MADIRERLGIVSVDETIQYVKMLFYGEPGIGKTYLLGTLENHPDLHPAVVMDVDGGLATIREQIGRKAIDPKPIKRMQDLVDSVNMLYEDTSGYYKTVLVDNLSELAKRDMQEVMREMKSNPKNEHRDPDIPDKREWGKSNEHVRRIVRAFKDLPMHVIFTAHVREWDDEAQGLTRIGPAFPGQLRNEVPGFLDVVGYMHNAWVSNEEIRRVQFAKTRRVNAKDRYQALGTHLDNPSMPMIWQLIQDGNGGSS